MFLVLLAAAVVLVFLMLFILFCIRPAKSTPEQRRPFQNRNFAHRGLFEQDQSRPENSIPAFIAAAAVGYGIELDVQFTRDKRVVVFHDDTLDRMTLSSGFVSDIDYEELCTLPLKGTTCRAPLFAQVLATVGGRVPLIVEIKSRGEFSTAYLDELCTAVLKDLRAYRGAYCIESFDPRVVAWVRRHAPDVLRGQLADSSAAYRKDGANPLSAFAMSHCLGNLLCRPQFLAWCPAPRNLFVRQIARMGAMMVYWTALPQDDTEKLQRENDAVIFQWYLPEKKWAGPKNKV